MSRLNHFRRAVSGLLSVALTGSLCTAWLPAAAAAAETTALEKPATGSIALTLSFDLPQRVDAVRAQEVALAAAGGGEVIAQEIDREGLWNEYSYDIRNGETWYEVEVNAFGAVTGLESGSAHRGTWD